MNWFSALFGFEEGDWEWTQSQFELDGEFLSSKGNGRQFRVGRFSTPSLAELRSIPLQKRQSSRLTHEVIGDILEIHGDPTNAGAVFQVASQFNTLEFPSPTVTPEAGVTGYALDKTQGPACALATAPATVYRNYFAPVDDEIGQRAHRQINNLTELEASLAGGPYWEVRNGYIRADRAQLGRFRAALQSEDRDFLKGRIRIGLQHDTDVVFKRRYDLLQPTHRVTQAYCSAISCGYSRLPVDLWGPLAILVLEAAYEATLLAAAIDRDTGTGSGRVWLTMLGGGVFGNRDHWIADAIAVALDRTRNLGLDVRLAHYGELMRSFSHIEL